MLKLELENVSKIYRTTEVETRALDSVSFEVTGRGVSRHHGALRLWKIHICSISWDSSTAPTSGRYASSSAKMSLAASDQRLTVPAVAVRSASSSRASTSLTISTSPRMSTSL